MATKPLTELDDYELVHSSQDCRGWTVFDGGGQRVGIVREMLVDTDSERVTALVLDTGAHLPAENVALKDGKVVAHTARTGPATTTPGTPRAPGESEVVMPVVQEEIRIGKRGVDRGGVRVSSHVEERPVEETVKLREEQVHVERRATDRPASEAELAKGRERTVEMTAHSEEPVVQKQARVVEEVVVSKDATVRDQTIRDTTKRTDVDVERLDEKDQTKRRP